jgi:hypothetical protein
LPKSSCQKVLDSLAIRTLYKLFRAAARYERRYFNVDEQILQTVSDKSRATDARRVPAPQALILRERTPAPKSQAKTEEN